MKSQIRQNQNRENTALYPELLAPAGNVESFYGAILAGADAIYLGGKSFGARAYADNFTTEELVDCIRYAHLFGRKVYLTVNTLLKETELPDLYDYLAPFYQAGLDAVIVQDMGVLRLVRSYFPKMEIHASTQMTLCSKYGASLLKEMGASRIVPARELSLTEIRVIKDEVDIEIETFIHGAMCYCYSGQCLFSSILGGRSGNRGRCAQPCRLPYTVKSQATSKNSNRKNLPADGYYPLSLKDMCTIEHIPDLVEAGIDSFKIEGRMKKPEYAAGVTALYRKYLDRYYDLRDRFGVEEAKKRFRVEEKDLRALSNLYIRSEKQSGYYKRYNGKEMVSLDSPAYHSNDEALLSSIREKFLAEKMRLPVSMAATLMAGEKATITLYTDTETVTVEGELVDKAQNRPLTEENVQKQLSKLGDTHFYAERIDLAMDEDVFYSLKALNELRREAIAKLESLLLPERTLTVEDDKVAGNDNTPEKISATELDAVQKTCGDEPSAAVLLTTIEQLVAFSDWLQMHDTSPIKRVYIDADLLVYEAERALCACEAIGSSAWFYAVLPYIIREKESGYLQKLSATIYANSGLFRGCLVRSLDGLSFVRDALKEYGHRADAGLYTWNKHALSQLQAFGITDGFCLPYELNYAEQRRLLDHANGCFEKIVYGRIPMMLTANCVLKTTAQCEKLSGSKVTLSDRYKKSFPVVRNCNHCMNIIYNSLPLSLWNDRERWLNLAQIRLDFTIERAAEMNAILDAFFFGSKMPDGEYTTGHEKRGVE